MTRFETVNEAFNAYLAAGDFATTNDPRGFIRTSNVLLDACIDAGMDRDCADHHAWAAEFVTQELLAA